MKYPFKMIFHDPKRAVQMKHKVQIGHYFVFIKDNKPSNFTHKLKRLLVKGDGKHQVVPLVDNPVQLEGVTITPTRPIIDPISTVVTERNLYHAEQDVVHLFIAFPKVPKHLRLVIKYNGKLFTERKVQLTNGMAIESFAMLPVGSYSAQLSIDDRLLGIPTLFTVAEYTLAPLSARLLSHTLKREVEQLWFELAVESYQKPYTDELLVILLEQDREVTQIGLLAQSPGRYAGGMKISGEGPFHFRLIAANDAERVAEVAIPGSRKIERQVTIISELGPEKCFAMMPEVNAVPLRGGYLTTGEFIATPLTVEAIVTKQRLIQVNTNIESLVLVSLDLTSGNYSVQEVGDINAGNTISASNDGPMSTVFIGGFVNGQPFEGYTTFIEPLPFQLSIDAPSTIYPRTDLVLRLNCEGMENQTIPVLLSVRDERLTTRDKPEVSLGAAAKRAIDVAIEGMNERAFDSLMEYFDGTEPKNDEYIQELLEEIEVYMVYEHFDQARDLIESAINRYPNQPEYRQKLLEILATVADKEAALAEEVVLYENSCLLDEDCEVSLELADTNRLSLTTQAIQTESHSPATKDTMSLPPEYPEVLFYDIVFVSGTKEVILPLGDSLATFTVEAFAMNEGNWTQNQTTVVVDKPVRVDLELPLAVYPGDKVMGRLHAITSSRKARITLTHNGNRVAFESYLTPLLERGEVIDTPVELEFFVKSGNYVAKVTDYVTDETATTEVIVGEPGRFKSYVKELGLLQSGETITLKPTDILNLQIFPTLDTPFDTLITATASYTHLCCEQTAAKILAATFMYLTANNDGQRNTAEKIILAGVARERNLLAPGRGFMMYPNENYINDYYSRLTVRYLWKLSQLDEIPNISTALRQAVREGLSLADQVSEVHRMQRLPKQIHDIEDAYMLALSEAKTAEQQVRQYIEKVIDFSGNKITLKNHQHAVADRKVLAYAAAGLIAIGDLTYGIKLANQVTRQFNEQGRLYSTEDSIAAIALLIQLKKSEVFAGIARVRVNGQAMTTLEALQLQVPVESIEVLEGVAAVIVTRMIEEDWQQFTYQFPLKIEFRNTHDQKITRFETGQRTDLVISLPDGYQIGDLVHVALPASLSWIQGGGKVKRFSRDFEGQDELRIPLIVTAKIAGKQHFAVCVRNMFKEERASSLGMLTVEGK
jgi:hypothetical protein